MTHADVLFDNITGSDADSKGWIIGDLPGFTSNLAYAHRITIDSPGLYDISEMVFGLRLDSNFGNSPGLFDIEVYQGSTDAGTLPGTLVWTETGVIDTPPGVPTYVSVLFDGLTLDTNQDIWIAVTLNDADPDNSLAWTWNTIGDVGLASLREDFTGGQWALSTDNSVLGQL